MSDLAPFTDEQNNQDLIAKDSNQQIGMIIFFLVVIQLFH